MSALTTTDFVFDAARVRVVQRDGVAWFVAADVCAVLGLGNTTQALSRVDDDETTLIPNEALSGSWLNAVNESGLYSLVLGSRKPEAKRFKKWVTAEVLPSIRKTGQYGAAPALPNYTEALRQLADQIERNEQQAAALTIAAPKAEALDRLAAAEGSMCITDAAKSIGIKPKALFAWLMAHEWIYRRPGKASYLAYQTRIQQGVLEHKVTTVQREDGSDKVCEQVQVTPKGLARLSLDVRAV